MILVDPMGKQGGLTRLTPTRPLTQDQGWRDGGIFQQVVHWAQSEITYDKEVNIGEDRSFSPLMHNSRGIGFGSGHQEGNITQGTPLPTTYPP